MKLAIAVIGGLVLAGPARALDSGELLAACVRLDRDMKVNGSDVSIPSSVDNGVCWGFIAAVQQLANFYEQGGGGQSILKLCVPIEVKRTQLVKVFVAWGQKNPEKLHHPAGLSVINSFVAAFPCPK